MDASKSRKVFKGFHSALRQDDEEELDEVECDQISSESSNSSDEKSDHGSGSTTESSCNFNVVEANDSQEVLDDTSNMDGIMGNIVKPPGSLRLVTSPLSLGGITVSKLKRSDSPSQQVSSMQESGANHNGDVFNSTGDKFHYKEEPISDKGAPKRDLPFTVRRNVDNAREFEIGQAEIEHGSYEDLSRNSPVTHENSDEGAKDRRKEQTSCGVKGVENSQLSQKALKSDLVNESVIAGSQPMTNKRFDSVTQPFRRSYVPLIRPNTSSPVDPTEGVWMHDKYDETLNYDYSPVRRKASSTGTKTLNLQVGSHKVSITKVLDLNQSRDKPLTTSLNKQQGLLSKRATQKRYVVGHGLPRRTTRKPPLISSSPSEQQPAMHDQEPESLRDEASKLKVDSTRQKMHPQTTLGQKSPRGYLASKREAALIRDTKCGLVDSPSEFAVKDSKKDDDGSALNAQMKQSSNAKEAYGMKHDTEVEQNSNEKQGEHSPSLVHGAEITSPSEICINQRLVSDAKLTTKYKAEQGIRQFQKTKAGADLEMINQAKVGRNNQDKPSSNTEISSVQNPTLEIKMDFEPKTIQKTRIDFGVELSQKNKLKNMSAATSDIEQSSEPKSGVDTPTPLLSKKDPDIRSCKDAHVPSYLKDPSLKESKYPSPKSSQPQEIQVLPRPVCDSRDSSLEKDSALQKPTFDENRFKKQGASHIDKLPLCVESDKKSVGQVVDEIVATTESSVPPIEFNISGVSESSSQPFHKTNKVQRTQSVYSSEEKNGDTASEVSRTQGHTQAGIENAANYGYDVSPLHVSAARPEGLSSGVSKFPQAPKNTVSKERPGLKFSPSQRQHTPSPRRASVNKKPLISEGPFRKIFTVCPQKKKTSPSPVKGFYKPPLYVAHYDADKEQSTGSQDSSRPLPQRYGGSSSPHVKCHQCQQHYRSPKVPVYPEAQAPLEGSAQSAPEYWAVSQEVVPTTSQLYYFTNTEYPIDHQPEGYAYTTPMCLVCPQDQQYQYGGMHITENSPKEPLGIPIDAAYSQSTYAYPRVGYERGPHPPHHQHYEMSQLFVIPSQHPPQKIGAAPPLVVQPNCFSALRSNPTNDLVSYISNQDPRQARAPNPSHNLAPRHTESAPVGSFVPSTI